MAIADSAAAATLRDINITGCENISYEGLINFSNIIN